MAPNQQVLQNLNARLLAHAERRARQGQGFNADLHRLAPRGGDNLNRFGQPRSGPFEPPATETTRLLDRIQSSLLNTERGTWQWESNYAVLEDGYSTATRVLLPRPLRRLTIATMKQAAQSSL